MNYRECRYCKSLNTEDEIRCHACGKNLDANSKNSQRPRSSRNTTVNSRECKYCKCINTEDEIRCRACGRNIDTQNDSTNQKEKKDGRAETQGNSNAKRKSLHTHYDNLKVARNAPPEVIRAAYRVLAQKYHPDCNPGISDAARIMAIINASYEILSDPNKRQEHDLWIAQCERPYEEPVRPAYQARPSATPEPAPSAKTTSPRNNSGGFFSHVLRNWLWYSIAAFAFWGLFNDQLKTPQPGPKPYQAARASVKPAYIQPSSAPNGQLWPPFADYVTGYQQLHTSGLSKVTVDNSQNDSPVFVKLVSLTGANAYPVRTFYIPAYDRFTLANVDAGNYDIRYRNLSTGGLSRSDAFVLEETPTYNGTQFSNLTMTLYKVRNGNMQTHGLSEDEF